MKAVPIDPNWKAACASNLLEVLPQEDITAYTEVSNLVDSLTHDTGDDGFRSRRIAFEQRFRVSPAGGAMDFSTASREQLMQDLSLLSEECTKATDAYEYNLYLRGCLTAVLHGERDLDRIDDDENQVESEGMKQLRQNATPEVALPQSSPAGGAARR